MPCQILPIYHLLIAMNAMRQRLRSKETPPIMSMFSAKSVGMNMLYFVATVESHTDFNDKT